MTPEEQEAFEVFKRHVVRLRTFVSNLEWEFMHLEHVLANAEASREAPEELGVYSTYEEARTALETAVRDVEADLGKDAVDQGWRDLVMGIAADCTPDVADELIRRNL